MFKYNEFNKKIAGAVRIANLIIEDNDFYMKLKGNHTYEDSNATGSELCKIAKAHRASIIIVKEVKPRWRYSKMKAVFNSSRPNELGLNKHATKNRLLESLVGAIIHEWFHALDHKETNYRFGHGDNSSNGKGLTVPYFAGKAAKELCMKKYHKTPIKKKRSKWYNPLTWF